MTTTRPPTASAEPPPTGRPAIRQPAPPSGVLRALLGLPVRLYHAHLGVLLGHRFILLVHTGRKTGLHRETVLEVVKYDPVTRESVTAAGWGRRTGWLHNVEAGLAHEVRTGRQRFAPAYRILPPDEAERIFADYERRNRFIAPVIRVVLSRLLGWRYDGTPAARRRAVEQLSLVGFRPASDAEATRQRPAPKA
jgi:deazaflavin-dependent oxidoreductase (nitroreductase family)